MPNSELLGLYLELLKSEFDYIRPFPYKLTLGTTHFEGIILVKRSILLNILPLILISLINCDLTMAPEYGVV